MTVKRIYGCDICRRDELPDSVIDEGRELIGFEYGPRDEIKQKGSRQVEHHICKKCLVGMYRLAIEAGVTK